MKIRDELGYTPFHVLAYKYPKEFLKRYPYERNRELYEVEDGLGNTIAHVVALRGGGFPFDDKELLMKTNNVFVSLAEIGILMYGKEFSDEDVLNLPSGFLTGLKLKEVQEIKKSSAKKEA